MTENEGEQVHGENEMTIVAVRKIIAIEVLMEEAAMSEHEEEALNHHINNNVERDTEHETASESIIDNDTKTEIQEKIKAVEWNSCKEMGLKRMPENTVGKKKVKDMLTGIILGGKRVTLKKFKEDRKNAFKGIGKVSIYAAPGQQKKMKQSFLLQ